MFLFLNGFLLAMINHEAPGSATAHLVEEQTGFFQAEGGSGVAKNFQFIRQFEVSC